MAYDWEKAGPSQRSLEALLEVKSEAEFPDTYSGQAWLAAYRIWKACKDHPEKLLTASPYGDIDGVDLKGWDGTGFMYGWALNAVRQMLGMKPGPNGAIVTLGGPQEDYPASCSANADLHRALGSKE